MPNSMLSSPPPPSDSSRILIVEDERPIRRFIRISLESNGYKAIEAENATKCLQIVTSEPPEAILLDLGLPDQDGLDVIKQIREWSNIPIIVLSARGNESDKVLALDLGADDYLTKPFSVGELLARIRVAIRHARTKQPSQTESIFCVEDLVVDQERRIVSLKQQPIHLTPTEYRLLQVLVTYAGRVVTHRQLLKSVWGPDSVHENQYLRVYMGTLRRKIEPDATRPRYIKTESGIGYRLVDE